MPRRVLLLPFGAVALAIYVGCGLTNLSGELVAEPDGGDGTPPDGGDRHSASDGAASPDTGNGGNNGGAEIDAGPPPPTCQTDACALPAGGVDFGVVLYGDRSTACPTGFDPTDLVESPTGTCACGACAVSGVNCNSGTIPTRADNDNSCTNSGTSLQANNGNCSNQSGSWATWASVAGPAAQGGTCSVQPSTSTKGGSVGVRICTPQSTVCSAELCTPPPSFKACSVHNGDNVQCPAGAPNKHVIGSDFAPVCSTCGCSITKKNCLGTLTAYQNSNCTGSTRTLAANTCVNMNGFYQNSSKWTGEVDATCATGAAPAATFTWTGAKTVCCPN